MPHEPLVSVIIPTYNSAHFVPVAVQSVLDQTFKNVEVILVNDGSTDDTDRVIKPFGRAINYITTENKGVAHARNVGMRVAQGKYIAFLDADDLYLPHKLALQVSFLETHPEAGMAWTEVSSLTREGISEEYHLRSYHRIYNRKGWSYEDVFPVTGEFSCSALGRSIPFYMGDAFKYTLMGTCIFSNTVLFPREILREVGYQKEDNPICQDYEFVVRLCRYFHYAALDTAFLNVPTYLYRYHEHQISKPNQPKTRERLLAEIEIEKGITQTIVDWGYGDKEYYRLNCDWLDRQLAAQYLCLGEKWLEHGDVIEARECFRAGISFDPNFISVRRALRRSFFPSTLWLGMDWMAAKLRVGPEK